MYDNGTKLDDDFMKNEAGFEVGLTPHGMKIKYKDYYLNICNVIFNLHYLRPTRLQVEEYIATGEFIKDEFNKLICPIGDPEERAYLFRMAQAKQLIYDTLAGRGAMLRGEDGRYNLCPDTIDLIKQMGLYQRTLFCE